ncbi:MAG: type II and III secretion system protein [Myxococcota bacterium]|nr:type II and III secretion system protein [Myxococcota bacterium]
MCFTRARAVASGLAFTAQAYGRVANVVLNRSRLEGLLELEILDLQLGDDFTSVFDVDYTSTGQTSGPASGEPRNPLLPADQTVTTGPNTALGVGNFPLDGGQLLFQWMNENVRVRLQLAEEQNRIKTLGSPILLASNNTPARIFVGEEVVLTTGVRAISNFGAIGAAQNIIQPETQVVDIGNTLEIVPRVNSDGTVTLSVNSDISTLKKDATFIPISTADGNVVQYPVDGVNDSTVKGTFLAEDGMTVAVGGLVRTSDSLVEQKVPFLGDIKYLGFFFKSEKRTQKTSELIVLITPRVFWNSNDAETRSLDLVEELSAAGVRDGFASDGRRLLLEAIEGHHEFNDEDDVLELETRGSKGNEKTGAE